MIEFLKVVLVILGVCAAFCGIVGLFLLFFTIKIAVVGAVLFYAWNLVGAPALGYALVTWLQALTISGVIVVVAGLFKSTSVNVNNSDK